MRELIGADIDLMCDINGLTVEYMPWANRLFRETPNIADGKIEVPARPGLGLEFDEKVPISSQCRFYIQSAVCETGGARTP